MIEASSVPVEKACKVFEVSKQSFYGWKRKDPPPHSDKEVIMLIHSIALEFPKYGYRRVTHALRRMGRLANHKRVLSIMRQENLLVRRKKYKPKTTQSNHGLPKYTNLTKDFVLKKINQIWVADITYIVLGKGFVYLAAIMDLYSRRCVGWTLSRHPNAQLTLDALNMAIALRGEQNVKDCIHHSDQGVQYAAQDYVQRLRKVGMQPSMGEKGNSYENAHAESFFKTLKNEEVWMNEYETLEDVYCNIKRFIEEVYNKKRLHSSIGYQPPVEFEQWSLNRSVA